jgi:pyridoxamine 5'-phosphate oxidase
MDDLRDHIKKLREDFSRGALNEDDADADPSKQFAVWMAQAVEARVPEVQAMSLCTVSPEGQPSSRIVYLREFGAHDFSFYTNYKSKKAKELEANPRAALTFFWPQLERQIRIEGDVKRSDPAGSDAYFNLRPYDSKLGAWASMQSGALKSREELEANVESMRKRYPPSEIKRPEFWGGLVLTARYYEFWQGRKSRLHDRLSYFKEGKAWRMQRLYP